MIRTLAISGSLYLLSLPLQAQEFRTLEDIVAEDHEPSYPIVRCAAFYQASVEWAGTNALGEESVTQSKSAIENLIIVATTLRQRRSGGELEHVAEVLFRDVAMIKELYLNDFQQSYSRTGSAWDGNSLWESDLQSCKYVAEISAELADQIRGGGQ